MSNLFRSREPDFIYGQAVIVEINLQGVAEFGSKKDKQNIEQLESNIAHVLPEQSGIDGHEFGDGECIIYIYGPSADKIFGKIESALRSSDFGKIDITLQYGLPDDPNTRDRKFSL